MSISSSHRLRSLAPSLPMESSHSSRLGSNRILSRSLPRLPFFLCLVIGIGSATAQTAPDQSWQATAEARFKAIYEHGEFRPLKVQVEWLPDSSGYTIEERQPGSDKPTKVTYQVRSGERITATEMSANTPANGPVPSPDGTRYLEYEDRTLFVREVTSGKRTPLIAPPTRSGNLWFNRPAWSPDGRRVVFEEVDYTNVRKRAVLDAKDPSFPTVEHHHFARVGEAIPRFRIGVVDSDGRNLTWLALPSPEEGFYLGKIEWAGNSEEVLVEQFSRFRNRRDFFLAKTTGEPQRIFHEVNDAWFDASQHKNAGLTWIRGGTEFVVINETDGWRHAHRFTRDGKALGVITPGNYDIIDRAVIDEVGGWYYFYASPDNATQKHLYRVTLDGTGILERLTPADQPGTHNYQISPDTKWAIHTFSTMDTPPVSELIELPAHRVVRVLQDNRNITERIKGVITHPTEFLQLSIAGGVTMDAWMLKPKDFDPTKKYPVFIYVYGEPHLQTVLNEWGEAQTHFHRVIADLGYLVVSIDNRGTPAPKGAAWRRSVFGSLGPLSTEEQEAGLKELARMRPYVDLSRVGIWGWSGGGSNTLNALFRKPDSYHLGIAVVPKPQPHLYNAGFQEIFMHTPAVNPDGYQRAAAINYADGLKGNLLIITGSGETNTHIQIIEGLVDRLIELRKPFDYMVYPNRDHGLQEGKGTVVHVRMLIARYLMEHLPAGAR